jgi:hypothetical protein
VRTRGSGKAQLPAAGRPSEIVDGNAISPQTKREKTMRSTILTMLIVPLMATFTAQTVAAAEHHHARTKARAGAIEQFRNSNAYAAPAYIAAQPYWSGYDGAAGSGMAGH